MLVLFPVFKNEAILNNWATTWQNPQNDLCAQQRHWSSWASTQSDQSSLSAWRSIGSLATHWAHREEWSDRVDALADLSLRLVHLLFCWFCHAPDQYLSCDMTKPTKWVCAKWRLRSAWASAVGMKKAWVLGSLAIHSAQSEDSDQTGRMPRLIWVFDGRTLILLVLSWMAHF